MSKSQSREVFARDDASVLTTGLSGLSAGAGQELVQRQTALLFNHMFLSHSFLTMQCSFSKSNTEYLHVANSQLCGLGSELTPEPSQHVAMQLS